MKNNVELAKEEQVFPGQYYEKHYRYFLKTRHPTILSSVPVQYTHLKDPRRLTADALVGLVGLDCAAGAAGQTNSFENLSTSSESLKGCN